MAKNLTLQEQIEQEKQAVAASQARLAELEKLNKEKGERIQSAEKQISAIKAKAQSIVDGMSKRKTVFQEAQSKDREALKALNTEITEIRSGLKEVGFIPPEMFYVKVNRKGQLVALAKPGPKKVEVAVQEEPTPKKGKKVAAVAQ